MIIEILNTQQVYFCAFGILIIFSTLVGGSNFTLTYSSINFLEHRLFIVTLNFLSLIPTFSAILHFLSKNAYSLDSPSRMQKTTASPTEVASPASATICSGASD